MKWLIYYLTQLFDKANTENSYINPNKKPKNKAHKGVKFWYKFKNRVILDGNIFDVVFNIIDKGKNQYQYLIEFHHIGEAAKKQMHYPRDTAINSFARLEDASVSNSKAQFSSNVNKKKQTSLRDYSGMTYSQIMEEQQKAYQRERELREAKRKAESNPDLLKVMDEYMSFHAPDGAFSEMKNP